MSPLEAAAIFTIATAILVIGGLVLAIYNAVVALRLRVDKAWANIEVVLRQRFDQLPALVDAVRGYLAYERETLERVTRARAAWSPAQPVHDQAVASEATSAAVRSLFAVVENYPELKANQNVLELQEQLTTTENQISFSRQHYNASVLDYNTSIATVPNVFIAGPFGFTKREFFDAEPEAHNVPKVDLSMS
jgi:LemA protein